MKRKVIAISTMLATILMGFSCYAGDGVDLSSMSLSDLISLKNAINQEIAEKGGDNIIGDGVYEVGVDIKSDNFKLSCYPGTEDWVVSYTIYENKYAYNDNISMRTSEITYDKYNGDDQEVATLNLKDGEILVIEGTGIIDEIVGASWMPDKN